MNTATVKTLSQSPAAVKARAARAAKKATPATLDATQVIAKAMAAAAPIQPLNTDNSPVGAEAKGLAAAKRAAKRPVTTVKADALKAAAELTSGPVTRPAPVKSINVTAVSDFNGMSQDARETWYEAATGKDASKVEDLLGACVKAFKAGKNPQLTSAGAVVKHTKASDAPKAVKAPAAPLTKLSAPPADARLVITTDAAALARIRAGFTYDMLQAAIKLAKKGPFTRAELFAKFPEVSRAKLTDSFYDGTKRAVYVRA